MKIAYFDCFSGISGDMCLGALVDAGVSLKELEAKLGRIPLGGYRLSARRVTRAGLSACKVDVVLDSYRKPGVQRIRKWNDIEGLARKSTLPAEIKRKGLDIFKRLFEAESRVHGGTFREVHLHELGAVDCVVDVFGTIIGLDMLGVRKVYASPINLGSGTVRTDSGVLPVPAPAVCEIVKGLLVYSGTVRSELTTPTGAAILRGIASSYGEVPSMQIDTVGTGAGRANFRGWPNVLRILAGNVRHAGKREPEGRVTVIETNIDDMNPQIYEHVAELLLKHGALDVYLTQILMKKGRPGVKLTVLCVSDLKKRLANLIFRETTTIGLRYYEVEREVLGREIRTIDTEFGRVRVKSSRHADEMIRATPEYEDCRKIAKKTGVPLIDVVTQIKRKIDYR